MFDRAIDVDVSPAIAAMLNEMPRNPGDAWKTAERQKWLKAFDAVLSLVYPEDRPGSPSKPAQSESGESDND